MGRQELLGPNELEPLTPLDYPVTRQGGRFYAKGDRTGVDNMVSILSARGGPVRRVPAAISGCRHGYTACVDCVRPSDLVWTHTKESYRAYVEHFSKFLRQQQEQK